MNPEPTPPALPPPGQPVGLIVAGSVFILLWLALHYILFFFFFAYGIIGDAFLNVIRGTQLPGTMNENRPALAWGPWLVAAFALSASSGIPAGFAFFWRGRRTLLLLLAAVLLLVSLPVGLYAGWVLLKTSLLP